MCGEAKTPDPEPSQEIQEKARVTTMLDKTAEGQFFFEDFLLFLFRRGISNMIILIQESKCIERWMKIGMPWQANIYIYMYIYMHIQNCVVIKCARLYLYVNPLIIYVFFSSRVHGHPTWRLSNDYMYYMWLWKPNILMVLHTVDGSKIQL